MIVAAATNQLLVAQHACRAIKSEFSNDNVPWSLTHSFSPTWAVSSFA